MKKNILGFILLLSISSVFAQNSTMRVAVSFNTDTTFTILGPFNTKSVKINLNDVQYKQIQLLADPNSFSLQLEAFPEELSAAGNTAKVGIPNKYLLQSWIKKFNKSENYDLLLILYKPVKSPSNYSYLNGFSYGINTSKGFVFTLNDALVYNLKTMELLAATSIESESDFIAGSFEIDKSLPNNHEKNMDRPIEMINKLNQDFALKVVQCLTVAKKKLENSTKK